MLGNVLITAPCILHHLQSKSFQMEVVNCVPSMHVSVLKHVRSTVTVDMHFLARSSQVFKSKRRIMQDAQRGKGLGISASLRCYWAYEEDEEAMGTSGYWHIYSVRPRQGRPYAVPTFCALQTLALSKKPFFFKGVPLFHKIFHLFMCSIPAILVLHKPLNSLH